MIVLAPIVFSWISEGLWPVQSLFVESLKDCGLATCFLISVSIILLTPLDFWWLSEGLWPAVLLSDDSIKDRCLPFRFWPSYQCSRSSQPRFDECLKRCGLSIRVFMIVSTIMFVLIVFDDRLNWNRCFPKFDGYLTKLPHLFLLILRWEY